MKRFLYVLVAVWVAAALTVGFAAQSSAHQLPVKCSDESPGNDFQNSPRDCRHVQQVIHEVWPDSQEHHAIYCFSDESGLDKWANVNEASQYKGVAQMSRAARRMTDWAWRVKAQIRAALRWWRMNGRWGAWTASSC